MITPTLFTRRVMQEMRLSRPQFFFLFNGQSQAKQQLNPNTKVVVQLNITNSPEAMDAGGQTEEEFNASPTMLATEMQSMQAKVFST